jgi:hypothetical protein
MKASLSPSWDLSTEHAASRHGQPVLVNRSTGEAFGAGDIVTLHASYGYMIAAEGVARLAKRAKLTAKGKALVAQFVGSVPPR